jgi:hypothetical protein
MRPQPGQQLGHPERLGQVVVGAQVEPVGLVVLAVLGRQDEHRHPVLLGPQPLADLVAGQLGQHQVEDDGVVGAFPGQVQAIGAVEGQVDGEPFGLQAPLHRAGQPPFVFHHEHAHVLLLRKARDPPKAVLILVTVCLGRAAAFAAEGGGAG